MPLDFQESPEERLFKAALGFSDDEREAFIERSAEGDDALAEAALRLLAGYRKTGGDEAEATMAGDGASARQRWATSTEEPGTVIGDFTLVRKIGEGGMGTVWEAEQSGTITRRVALKVIKLGMDTAEVVARFERERQTLALLEDPNIAGVYEAGATELGRPFFAMEFVDGEPITSYCAKHDLSLDDRLSLMLQLSSGIEHAHRKGVIHRDLKPSNILVNADGVPKIIDFGIAKAAAEDGGTLFTREAQMLGTPAYMSPEQAGGVASEIDTRSDVYSLGVVLYELLAGAPPFDPDRLASTGVAEMQKILSEEEPPKPSTRQTTAHATPNSELRTPNFDKDLDWIVMQAMAKEPERRYQTAAALSEDLQRYLDGDAVTAVPPTATYRFGKFVRRNKLAVTAASAVLLSLLAALAVSLVQMQRANQHAAEAEHARAETTFTIADLYTNNGVAAGRNGDTRTAALWFATAANVSAGDPERVNGNLVRATSWRDEAPTVVRACQAGVDSIKAVSWHPGGQHLIASKDRNRALIISLESESPLAVPGLGEWFQVARWSHDGRYLAAVVGKVLKVVAFPSGEEIASTKAGSVEHLEWSPDDDCLTAGGDSGVFLWNPFVKERVELDGGANFVGARFSADGTRLLLHGQRVTIRGVADLNMNLTPQLIADAGRGAGFLGKGEAFYFASGLDIQVHDSLSGDRLETHTTTVDHPDWGRALGASADGRFLIASGHQPIDRQGASAKAIDYRALFHTFSCHPDGDRLAISDANNKTRIFDAPNGRVVQEIAPIRLPASAVAYSPGGQYLATGHASGVVRVWRTEPKPDGQVTLPIPSHLFAISQDRQKIVPAGSGNYAAQPLPTTQMFDLKTGGPVGEPMRSGGAIMNAAISGGGQWCALAVATAPPVNGRQAISEPGQVEFFNPVTGEPLCAPFACRSQPRGLAVHPDGDALGVFCADGSTFEIAVANVDDALQIEARALFDGGPANNGGDSVSNGRCRYSEDGQHLMFFGHGHFHIWDRANAVKVAHDSRANGVHEIDPRGDKLAVSLGGGAPGVGVFDLSHEKWVGEPIPFTHAGIFARFDASGDHVLTNSSKDAAQVFDWRSGQPVGPAFDQSGTLLVGDFIDGTPWVATGGFVAGDLRIWDGVTGFDARRAIRTRTGPRGLEYVAECRRLIVATHYISIFDLDRLLPEPQLDPVSAQQLAELDAAGRVRRGGGLDVLNNDEWLPLWRDFRAAHPDFPDHAVTTEPLPDAPDRGPEGPGFWAQAKAAQAAAETRRAMQRAELGDAEIITPVRVTSSTAAGANPDSYAVASLIDSSGLSGNPDSSDAIAEITHAIASNVNSWLTERNDPRYYEGESALPAPVLIFSLPQPTTVTGFAYWAYRYAEDYPADGNQPLEFRFTFLDGAGQPLADSINHSVPRPIGATGGIIPLPKTPEVKAVKVELLNNFDGDRVGLGEVRFLSGFRMSR